jgi:hypothetical protein
MLARRDLEAPLRRRFGSLRLAVIGHVEWAEFLRVPHLPTPGEIVHVIDRWETAGGGGAVTAVQLARLAGHATFFTALGDDELGHRAAVASTCGPPSAAATPNAASSSTSSPRASGRSP